MSRLETRLDEMIEYAQRAMSYSIDMNQHDFAENSQVQDAVNYCLIVIGETCKQLRDHHPEILLRFPHVEWKNIAGMRDVIAHQY